MGNRQHDILREGCALLDPVLRKYGFSYVDGPSGPGSGGPYATAAYRNGDRALELSYRYSLGLVTYRFGGISIDHESYMHFVPEARGKHKYPGFADEPLSGFRNLAYDLENFAMSFLKGEFAAFSECATAAEDWKRLRGLARLP